MTTARIKQIAEEIEVEIGNTPHATELGMTPIREALKKLTNTDDINLTNTWNALDNHPYLVKTVMQTLVSFPDGLDDPALFRGWNEILEALEESNKALEKFDNAMASLEIRAKDNELATHSMKILSVNLPSGEVLGYEHSRQIISGVRTATEKLLKQFLNFKTASPARKSVVRNYRLELYFQIKALSMIPLEIGRKRFEYAATLANTLGGGGKDFDVLKAADALETRFG